MVVAEAGAERENFPSESVVVPEREPFNIIEAPAMGEASKLFVTLPVIILFWAKAVEKEKKSRNMNIPITCSREIAFI